MNSTTGRSTNRVRVATRNGRVITGRLLGGTLTTWTVVDDAGVTHNIDRSAITDREWL